MNKPKITKGEWVAFNDRVESWKNRGKPSMIQITVCEVSDLGYGEQMANRKAISAVPEMIDELIEELKFLDELLTHFEKIGTVGVPIHERLLYRRHAIKKALKKAGSHDS